MLEESNPSPLLSFVCLSLVCLTSWLSFYSSHLGLALLIKIIWDSIFLKICIVLSTYFIKWTYAYYVYVNDVDEKLFAGLIDPSLGMIWFIDILHTRVI